MHDLETFLTAYIEAALWSTSGTDPEGNELESLEDFEVAPETEDRMRRECARFLETYGHLISEDTCISNRCYSADVQAGHDFWLTRKGHGCGFWDGDWAPGVEDLLTEASKRFGEAYLYVGDDGLVHQA